MAEGKSQDDIPLVDDSRQTPSAESLENKKAKSKEDTEREDAENERAVSGAKALLGFSTNQSKKSYFYVDAQKPVDSVQICIYNKSTRASVQSIPMEPMDQNRVYWRIEAFPIYQPCLFYFIVSADNCVFNDLNDKLTLNQNVYGKRSCIYTVFKYEQYLNNYVVGRFWFVRHVYAQMCNDKLSLQDSINEYDWIGFGYGKFPIHERKNVVHWITDRIKESGDQRKNVLFLGHVIQHFDRKLLSNSKTNPPLLKDLIQNDTCVMTLLSSLLKCSPEERYVIPDAEDLIASLICKVQHGKLLEMLIAFLDKVGTILLDKLSNRTFHWSEEDIEFLRSEDTKSFFKDPKLEKTRHRLWAFILKRARSPLELLQIQEVLKDTCPTYVSSSAADFKKAFRKLLTSKQTGSAVLDKTSWPAIPQNLKPDLVEPFIQTLKEETKNLHQIDSEQEEAIRVFFTDETALKNDLVKRELLEIFKNQTLSRVIADVLRDAKFKIFCWNEAEADFKKEIYQRVLSFSPQTQQQGNRLVLAFQDLNSVFAALDVCPLDGIKESAVTKCRERVNTEDLSAIADAYNQIQDLHVDVREEYFLCLEKAIEKEVKIDRASIVALLKNLPSKDETQKSKVESINKEILRCLCQDLKFPNQAKDMDRQGFHKVFEDVSKNINIWSALLDAWPPGETFDEFPQIVLLRNALVVFVQALEKGTIQIGDLKNFGNRMKDVVDVLQKMHIVFCISTKTDQYSLSNLVASSLEKEMEVFQTLQQVIKAVLFVKEITDDFVCVEDIDNILSELSQQEKSFEEKKLKEILDDDFLRGAKPFVDRLENIGDLMTFRVFKNAAIKVLERKSDDIFFYSRLILSILIDDGKSYLDELCKPLFENVSSMPVEDADEFLCGVDENTLQKELDFIQRVCNQEIVPNTKPILLRFLRYPEMRTSLHDLNKVLLSVKKHFEKSVFDFFTKEKSDYQDLGELYQAAETIINIEAYLPEANGIEVVKQLANSKELIQLLQETAYDDVCNLIDAVEEHSDTTIAAKEVSDFIEIHKLFAPVFQAQSIRFLVLLRERLSTLTDKEATAIIARIKFSDNNAHSLRNVYTNVANRGEMTKEIVAAALLRGRFRISNHNKVFSGESILTQQRWEYSMKYKDTDDHVRSTYSQTTTQSMEKLQDIKGRALLIVNSKKKQLSSDKTDVDFQLFIDHIDLLNDIVITGEKLQQSGHPDYNNYWCLCSSLEEIRTTFDELNEERQRWDKIVKEVKDSHFYLNFFHPKQLWILKEFINGNMKVAQEALSLLRFVDPSVTMDRLTRFDNCQSIPAGKDYNEQFRQIGLSLASFFKGSPAIAIDAARSDTKQGLSVAVLEKTSSQTAHVVMTLFPNMPPQPNKVLFCHENTTWDEIELFLRRCFTLNNNNVPHCLANVESLDIELQCQLIDAILDFQTKVSQYWLVLICRGDEHHHIVSQFQESVRKIPAMTDQELKVAFSSKFQDVSLAISETPRLGRTKNICQEASQKQKRLIWFSISGCVHRHTLVHRLSRLDIDKDCLLYIYVSEVDDPVLVDIFLFELIVLGMVSSSTTVFHLPTKFVSIEVPNTLQHHLKDSFAVTKCFRRINEKWDNIDDLVCSQENESAIQVVCQYLMSYDRNELEKEALTCKNLTKAKPLSESECRNLLKKHSPWKDLSFNTVEIFLNVLAVHLRLISSSPFFRSENLTAAVKGTGDIRKQIFEALVDVSIEFAKRSVEGCKEIQTIAFWQNYLGQINNETATEMLNNAEEIVRWADDNHFLVMFQQGFSISSLFRELDKVPIQVQKLFKSQNTPLNHLDNLSESELEKTLRAILNLDSRRQTVDTGGYVLTPDNVLKMVLIVQRIRARIPVIVMGETGCGKTSLVRYLAKCCDVKFSVMNFHAGIYEEDIVKFTEKQIQTAEEDMDKEVWVFFDEINTCDHLGLINDIICHRSLNGRELPPNIVFLAACNPYCLRSTKSITTAGLSGKTLNDEYSNLVYRVKPLPETMMDYVWDYGALDRQDERAYISRMVEKLNTTDPKLVVDLLATSQEFIRDLQSRYSVSLRDVRRCIRLVDWFMKVIDRPNFDVGKLSPSVKGIYQDAQSHNIEDRSIILALAHSYQSRIPSSDQRINYRSKLANVYRHHRRKDISSEVFNYVVRAEQEEILARMELPDGTAKNTALRENVFVILVCILNRLPIFVVGKPGCSKSLSMQVIISNLRGKDSKDDYFKTLPQLLVVSYQGSESSTSEGILKVFEKAQKYKEQNKDDESLPVVLLDEVGLAEISKYNPLKVLHRLLEPEEKELPDVAVVGISNWALDAAKMNRAIHLSRPEPTLEDLKETGGSILEAQLTGNSKAPSVLHENALQGLNEEMQLCLAMSYFDYQKKQIHPNFHGLRDYYSLVKCLSKILMGIDDSETSSTFQAESTFRSLQRSFGGLPKEDQQIYKIYVEHVKNEMEFHDELDKWKTFPISDLITDNLKDPDARHLMLITSGQSSLGIVDGTLGNVVKEKVVIYGSKFEEDQSEDYSYRTLSRIILHMEQECVLVLRDLENVYGSLYDMLNQNYVVVGQKKNCRVALGPYSNPMCQVNDGFRCVVLVDEKEVDYTDPPFLNRFEKQLLRYSDVLNKKELEVIAQLQTWVRNFCTVEGQDFNERDVFLGLQDDTLASLVLLLRQTTEPNKGLLQRCKEKLLDIATPDGVLRSLCSKQYKNDSQEIKSLHDLYFEQKPLHRGLEGYVNFCHKVDSSFKYFVMTHSSIHTDVDKCLGWFFSCQVEKLGAFKSERQLSKVIQRFFQDSNKGNLVFQCKPELDAEHMLLMKSTLEQGHEDYLLRCSNEKKPPTKSICIIVHLQRGKAAKTSEDWQFCFLNNWKQATVDALEQPAVAINEILGNSVVSLMEKGVLSLRKIMADKLMWCFTRLKYPQSSQTTQETISAQVDYLTSTSTMMNYLKTIVLRWITKHHDVQEDSYLASSLKACAWQVKVACDKNALLASSTLSGALLRYIDVLVRKPLAKAIFLIEDRLSFECCQRVLKKDEDMNKHQLFLAELITDGNLFNIDDLPDPHEAKCYELTQPGLISSLNFPFSLIFNGKVDSLRDNYLAKYKDLEKDEHPELFFQDLYDDIHAIIPQLFHNDWLKENLAKYLEDVFDFATAKYSSDISREERLKIMKAVFGERLRGPDESSFEVVLAQIYFILWKYESDFLSILQLYSCCKSVFSKDLDEMSRQYIHSFRNAMPENTSKNMRDVPFHQDDDDYDDYFNENAPDDYESNEIDDAKNDRHQTDEEEASSNNNSDDESDERSSDSDEDSDDSSDSHDSDEEDDSGSSDTENDEEDDDDYNKASNISDKENKVSHGESIPQKGELRNIKVMDSESAFLERFFNALCESLLPDKKLIERINGTKNWQTMVNTFISLVAKYSRIDETTHYIYLRICSDFANMVLDPHSLHNPFSLYMLSGLYDRGDNHGDLRNCFHELLDVIDGIETDTTDVNKFKVSFLSRCLQKCETEEFFNDIVTAVSLFAGKELCQMASPLVVNILQNVFTALKLEGYKTTYCSFLEGKANDSSFVQMLDDALNKSITQADGVTDCHVVTVFLDAFNKLMPGADLTDPDKLSDSNCEVISCLKNAIAVVKEPRRKQNVFMLLTGVSYLRSLLSSLAELVKENLSILKRESDYSSFLGYLNSIFEVPLGKDTNFPRKASCFLYFLKELKRSHSMIELQKLCSDALPLPILSSLNWDKQLGAKAFNIIEDSVMKPFVKRALQRLVASNESSEIKVICLKLSTSPNLRRVFAAVLIEDLYSPQSQADTVDNARDTIAALLPDSLSDPYRHFLMCLTGKEDLKKLRLLSSQPLQHRMIILHLMAILTSEVITNQIIERPFFSYLLNPMRAAQGCFLASADTHNQVPANATRICTCKCGTAFVRSDGYTWCPQHRKNCSTHPESIEIKGRSISEKVTLYLAKSNDELTVANMTPSSFRLLHMLVHSTLFAGVSLERFPEEKISQVLSTDANPINRCLEEISNDLHVLQKLWNCSEERVHTIVHQLMETLSSLLTNPIGHAALTAESRSQWQGQFSEKVEEFLQQQTDDTTVPNPKSLEAQIEEKDDTDNFDVHQRNDWIPRLFRCTKEESLDDFCSFYYSSTDDVKKRCPLIGLFLKNLNILPYLSHLYAIVNFPNMLEQLLRRRLSRNNSKTFIGDVIKGDNCEELKPALDQFCESWEFIRPEIKREVEDNVPHLSESSPTSYFLIDQGSDGQCLQIAIRILQKIQNDFQGQVLHLAMEGSCKALAFLRKSEVSCIMPIVHVQDATEDQIIQFNWDDSILSHSYHNTDYGRGNQICYDFEKIELELARQFLLGKVYLGELGGLKRFPYSNELFHTSTNVLNDVTQRMRQVPIDADMENRLGLIKQKKLESVQVLLEHLEVIICWLVKSSHLDPNMLLVDYVKRKLPKSNLLPESIFQDPKKEFKVCHIVGMYQKLEELFSAIASENVSDQYRSQLTENKKVWLEKITVNLGADRIDELSIVITSLRRFIFRYLLSEHDVHWSLDSHDIIVNKLDDPSLWPLSLTSHNEDDETAPAYKDLISKYVPAMMRAGEVNAVMTFYDSFVKSKQRKEVAKRTANKKTRSKIAPSFRSRFA